MKKKHSMGPDTKPPVNESVEKMPGKLKPPSPVEKIGKIPGQESSSKPKPMKPASLSGGGQRNKDADIAAANRPRPAKLPSKPLDAKIPPPEKKPPMGLAGSGAVFGAKSHAHGVSHCIAPVSSGVMGASRGK